MQKAKASLLLHPFFIACLVVLVWNDAYGKYAYPGLLTGKLSDVTGLIVLPVCCRLVFQNLPKKRILLFCAIFFTWWKSPFSQPLIDLLNAAFNWPVRRVVDYTDLIALAALPLAYFIQPRTLPQPPVVVACLRWTLGLLTFFSLCSTSVYRNFFQAHPAMNDVYSGEQFTVKKMARELLQILSEHGIAYRLDSVMYYPITNQDKLYYKTYTVDSGAAWQPVSTKRDSVLYVKWEGTPYYLIPEYRTADKTLRNIRFTLEENRKKTRTTITIQLFQEEGVKSYLAMDSKTRKAYRKYFATIFSEP